MGNLMKFHTKMQMYNIHDILTIYQIYHLIKKGNEIRLTYYGQIQAGFLSSNYPLDIYK